MNNYYFKKTISRTKVGHPYFTVGSTFHNGKNPSIDLEKIMTDTELFFLEEEKQFFRGRNIAHQFQ